MCVLAACGSPTSDGPTAAAPTAAPANSAAPAPTATAGPATPDPTTPTAGVVAPPPGPPPPATAAGPDGRRSVTVDGVERSFLERVPAGPVRTLVVDLHGLASSPEQQRGFAGLDAVADAEGWLVVRPAARGALRLWDERTDVAFVAALLDLARAEHDVPAGRVALVGFSAGGAAAGVLADLLGERVGAVVGIAPALLGDGPTRAAPLAVLPVATMDDPVVPYAASVAFARAWAEHAGCAPTSVPTDVGTPVTTTWSGCAAPVALLTVPGPAGHVVPDPACCDVDLTGTVAAFVRDALP